VAVFVSRTRPDRAILATRVSYGTAIAVFAAGIAAGALAMYRDFRVALFEAGPSNVPGSISRQLETVRAVVPQGEAILLVSNILPEELWYTRLIQRVLYPRQTVLIRYLPFPRAAADALRRRWNIRYGLVLDAQPADLGFAAPEDLGPLPALAHHVWFGSLPPP
jgi:hypothetical protein